MDHQTAFIITP